jgi:ubiquinone/menaquinone biosynthesis C-methylase UbiE
MAEMNRWLLWIINRRNLRRSERLLATVAPNLTLGPTSRSLELGAGLGGLSALVFEKFGPRRVVVTDFDPRQVDVARSFLTRRFGSLPPPIEVGHADAMSLPFSDASFECLFAIGVLHHVEHGHSEYVRRPQAVREVRRVLVPGGTFIYTEFTRTAELRGTLAELGFVPIVPTRRLGHQDLEVYRAPVPAPPG